MEHDYRIQFDLKGHILNSEHLPFEVKDGKIGDYFPMFSYLVPFYSIEEFTIEAYEFEIKSTKYIVDLILKGSEHSFNLLILDRTKHYSRLQRIQTELNEGKIENEYLLVSQENLNKKVQFYESLSTHMIDNLSLPLEQLISKLNDLSNKSNGVINKLDVDISFLKEKSAIMLTSIKSIQRYFELDPNYVKSRMEIFSLYEIVQEIIERYSSEEINIKNAIDRNVRILTSKTNLTKLISTTIENLVLKDSNNIVISADKNQERMLEIGFSTGEDFMEGNLNKESVTLILHPETFQEKPINSNQNNVSFSKYYKGSISTFYKLSKGAKVILSFPDLLLKAN